ncbi:MAG: MBL fold metallo-hydrolase [Pantoea sp. Brub]|nr:MBL fold metallo-hydrolase [Pantoea sp. Brub]
MNYHIIPVTNLLQNCSIIWCKSTRESVLIDPGGDALVIKQNIIKLNLKPCKILLTHGHLDHVGAALELSKFYNISIFGPHKLDSFWLKAIPEQSIKFNGVEQISFEPNSWLEEGDIIQVGSITFKVLHCPGHTPGHIVFFIAKHNLLVSGDVIFKGSIGRTDFPKGSHINLLNSIKNKLIPLGDDVQFIPGHGKISSIGFEKISNSFLKEFIFKEL